MIDCKIVFLITSIFLCHFSNIVNQIGFLIYSKLGGRRAREVAGNGGVTSVTCVLSETEVNHALIPLLDIAGKMIYLHTFALFEARNGCRFC